MWEFTGRERPHFAIEPGAGQESVWDYPRPPVAEPCSLLIEVRTGNVALARTTTSFRVKETASPPTVYLAPSDVALDRLVPSAASSFCEWKGEAKYFALADDPVEPVAWCYPSPTQRFAPLRNFVSFYPGRVECYFDGERVRAQPGGFYGGWITSHVVGPFKGEPGTGHW